MHSTQARPDTTGSTKTKHQDTTPSKQNWARNLQKEATTYAEERAKGVTPDALGALGAEKKVKTGHYKC